MGRSALWSAGWTVASRATVVRLPRVAFQRAGRVARAAARLIRGAVLVTWRIVLEVAGVATVAFGVWSYFDHLAALLIVGGYLVLIANTNRRA